LKQTTAARWTIFVGIILVVGCAGLLPTIGLKPAIGWLLLSLLPSQYGGQLPSIDVQQVMFGVWLTLMLLAGICVGILLIGAGAYVRLQSKPVEAGISPVPRRSVAPPAVPMSTPPAGLCPECGAANPPAGKYCDRCGTKLSG